MEQVLADNLEAEDEQVVGAPTAAAAALACVFCGAEPPHTSQPVSASCSHRACYYCVATARLASTRARCPSCGVRLIAPAET